MDTSKTPLEVHTEWLEDIRESVWDRISYENEMPLSIDALFRHWKRACWITDLWGQADKNVMILEELTSYGWKQSTDGAIAID